jgi:hypothetical protein
LNIDTGNWVSMEGRPPSKEELETMRRAARPYQYSSRAGSQAATGEERSTTTSDAPDQLEVTVVARGVDRAHRVVQMGAPMPDRELYHRVISDRNFVQYAHRIIRGLKDVSRGPSHQSQWYTFSLRFVTDGKTTLVYSGESSGSMWILDDLVSTRTVKTMGESPAGEVMWILCSCYGVPDYRNPSNEEKAKIPDGYVATCQIQGGLQYPSPASPYYRLIYSANLKTPEGFTRTVQGGKVEVLADLSTLSDSTVRDRHRDRHRDLHPCYAPELEAERTTAQQKLVDVILAEGWEQIGDGQFGMPQRMSAVPDKRYAICQIEPQYFGRQDRSREDDDYDYYEVGFRARGIRPNLDIFDFAWRKVDMHALYRVERGIRPDGIQHPWDICLDEQIAAWDDLIQEVLEDGWEQVNGVGKFRLTVAESYKYPMSWSQNRAKKW